MKNKITKENRKQIIANELLRLLQAKRFEDITVIEICKNLSLPRSTFYNYFCDTIDLLEFLLQQIRPYIHNLDISFLNEKSKTIQVFEKIYFFIEKNKEFIRNVLDHNKFEGQLMQFAITFIHQKIYMMINESKIINIHNIPKQILASYYASTIHTLLEACFNSVNPISKEEAIKYLEIFMYKVFSEAKEEEVNPND